MREYGLYVPVVGVVHDVRQGSAIVGDETDGMVATHYEGGGASNVTTLEDRIHHAAGRRETRYPTSATREWRREDVVRVGTVAYDERVRHWVISELVDEAALRAWVGEDEIVVGGSGRLAMEAAGRAYGGLTAAERVRVAAMGLPPAALADEILRTARSRG